MMVLLLLIGIVLASLLLTLALRRYALSRSLMDIPNERSSHSLPTPRGGGAAIVLTFLLGLVVVKYAGLLPAYLFWALVGGGGIVAVVGWIDDRRDIPARLRLPGHFAGALWALAWLGGLPALPVFGLEINLGIAGHILAAVYLVWLLNLYNFMDGINGIAGVEAITVCAGGIVLFWVSGVQADGMWILPALLAAAAAGFLYLNFPRARIFMGDAGSGFLGFALAALAVLTWADGGLTIWAWLILLGVFIVDASITLVRRVVRGERFYEAHRSHAYQHASRYFGAHLPVTVAVAVLNLVWLAPLAFAAVLWPAWGVVLLVVAWLPLAGICLYFRAGLRE